MTRLAHSSAKNVWAAGAPFRTQGHEGLSPFGVERKVDQLHSLFLGLTAIGGKELI